MFQQQVYVLNNILMVCDMAFIVAAGYIADRVCFELTGGLWRVGEWLFVTAVMFVMLFNNYVMGRFRLYDDRRIPLGWNLFWRVLQAVFIDFAALAASVGMMDRVEFSRQFVLVFGGTALFLLTAERLIAHLYINSLAQRRTYSRKLLVVGDRERANVVIRALDEQVSWGHEIVGRLSVGEEDHSPGTMGTIECLRNVLTDHQIDDVIFALDGSRNVSLAPYVEICRQMGIPARILPALWVPGPGVVSVENCQGVPFLTMRVNSFNPTGILYKRILDFFGGLAGTFLFLLMYPFVGLAIMFNDPGPVLFRQKRVGRNGRIFHIYKFRTMYRDAEARKKELMAQNEMSGAMFKLKDDPRVTRVGHFLRKTSLDEFPQFINVLLGDMSLVGTRPPTVDEVATYESWQRRRISEKPGLTGLWQISGRNEIKDFNDVVALDCQYMQNWRFSDDLKILWQTIMVVLMRKGAS
jgi:exopolysaccharide biosynthesis polyprenyl glycosylphosphotransferase